MNICPNCGIDIDVAREMFPDGWTTCEELQRRKTMREIKFRQAIFHPITLGFLRWHYWGLIDRAFVGIDTGWYNPTQAIKNSCKYTGLKDKNGVEIYEGDIVRKGYDGRATEVYWHQNTACWRRVGFTGMTESDMALMGEVIGNIWENPELLESGNGS